MTHAAGPWLAAETETWVRSAFDLLAQLPDVHRVGIALVEGGGRRLSFAASDRDNADRTDWCEIDAYEDIPLNNTVRTGRVIAGALDDLAARYPEFVGRQSSATRAFAAVPLSAAGQVIGGFALFFGTRQRFDATQLAELRELGERLGDELRREQRGRSRTNGSLADDPVPSGARVATYDVPPEPREVAGARTFVRRTTGGWGLGVEVQEVGALCVSELVTNALIHTAGGCEVRLVLDRGVLTASVRDQGTGGRRDIAAGDPLAVHGRGLHLVAALSSRWGSELDAGGMTVWCELDTA